MIANADTNVPDFDDMLKVAEPIINYMALRYSSRACPLEDMKQELRLALFLEHGKFDPQKSKLTTFVSNLLNHRSIDVCRRVGHLSRSGNQNRMHWAASTDAPVVNGQEFDRPEPQDQGDDIAEIDFADLCEYVDKRSCCQTAKARMLRVQGLSMKEVGKRLGISESRVSQMLSQNDDLEWLRSLIDHKFKVKLEPPNATKDIPMKVFSTGRIAKLCDVAPRTVTKWFDSGELKGYRIPGSLHRRVPMNNLIKFLNDNGMPIPEELQPNTEQA